MSGYDKEKMVSPTEADVIGWHNMYWSEGQVKVCFRPGGNFYCAEHQVDATWHIFDGELLIDWKKFGRYVLSVDQGKNLKGHAIPDSKNWRKTLYFGALTPIEQLLFGDGDGTEWEFKGPDGSFSVEFRADGDNHFVCPTIPGDAHWSIDKKGKTVIIDWGKNGKYELDIDVKKKILDGYIIIDGKEDPDEDKDWRTAEFKRNLIKPPPIVHGDDDEGHGDDHGHGHSHDGGHTHGEGHGSHNFGDGIVSLGNLTIASEKFMVDREGQVEKGFETTFGVERVGPGKATGFTAWVQDSKGQKLCEPVKGDAHDDHSHFTLMPQASDAQTFAISCGGQVSTISVHPGAAPANDGIMSVLEDEKGKVVGFIELKLHDDAGDLELWICKDGAMSEPLDFPASTTITLTFATHDNRSVQLNVRDHDQNEDEDGNPNMRDGMTNYFIFPGESEQDPEFLIGEKFRSTTTATFTSESKTYTAPPFILVPHQH
eukprot:CAMPEP_0197631184 /NCGR_PEP_ID=MMETSP1338-20131121/8438_1 /TAXON_ID=43686 ORGANISM="Pelagodinium beii, Strain RCC1491" /NCGR_SAMPLE_ID=MMETSP1338 /ASSEMBLY_ACC=CAM_ASM_000754 /LENGTH=484 /DNA_ID=CAMNT_0043202589 /DNA_START=23 /DNA_END=1477 /DNA_ORIENTATION=-